MSNTYYTQPQAYKHLLQVSQNIIYSSQVDEQILQKYQQLKTSILSKILPSSSLLDKGSNRDNNNNNSNNIDNSYYVNLVATYRLVIENCVKVLQKFQEELEGDMERRGFSEVVVGLNEGVERRVKQMEGFIQANYGNGGSSSSNSSTSTSKTRLLHRQQLTTLQYQHDQLDSKFQNMGLLIQVHKKMHEIILEATKTQQKKSSTQNSYKERIRLLEGQVGEVKSVKEFVEQHRVTEEGLREFRVATKALKRVMFGGGGSGGK